MISPVLIFVFVLFWLPGLTVWIQSLRYQKKLGAPNGIWGNLTPFSVLIAVAIVFPIYSVGLFTIFMAPKEQRALSLKASLEKSVNPEDTEEVVIAKNSVVYAMASLTGVEID